MNFSQFEADTINSSNTPTNNNFSIPLQTQNNGDGSYSKRKDLGKYPKVRRNVPRHAPYVQAWNNLKRSPANTDFQQAPIGTKTSSSSSSSTITPTTPTTPLSSLNSNNFTQSIVEQIAGSKQYSSEMDRVDKLLSVIFGDDKEYMNELHLFATQLEGAVNAKDGSFWKYDKQGYDALLDTVKKYLEKNSFPSRLSDPYTRDLTREEQNYIGQLIVQHFVQSFYKLGPSGIYEIFINDKTRSSLTDTFIRYTITNAIIAFNGGNQFFDTYHQSQRVTNNTTSPSSSSSSSSSSTIEPNISTSNPSILNASQFIGANPTTTTPVINLNLGNSTYPMSLSTHSTSSNNGLGILSSQRQQQTYTLSPASTQNPFYNKTQKAAIISFNKSALLLLDSNKFNMFMDFIVQDIKDNMGTIVSNENDVILDLLNKQRLYKNNSQFSKPIKDANELQSVIKNTKPTTLYGYVPYTGEFMKLGWADIDASTTTADEYRKLLSELTNKIQHKFDDVGGLVKLQIYDNKLKPPTIVDIIDSIHQRSVSDMKRRILKELPFETSQDNMLVHLVSNKFVKTIKGALSRTQYYSTLRSVLKADSNIVNAFIELCAALYRLDESRSSRISTSSRVHQHALDVGNAIDTFQRFSEGNHTLNVNSNNASRKILFNTNIVPSNMLI